MSVRAYFTICGAVILAALLFIVTGNFTPMVAVVFGFIGFGLTFMGMMNVLPIAVSHPAPPKAAKPKATPVAVPTKARAHAVHTWKSA